MVEIPFALEERLRRRRVELAAGATAVPMASGPKWVCQIVSESAEACTAPSDGQLAEARPWLEQLRPLNLRLGPCLVSGQALLASSGRDTAGRVGAYAQLAYDGAIEIVGTLPTGLWSREPCAWWPGSYEIPLVQQIETVYAPLLRALQPRTPSYLCMSLTGVQGSALIAKGQFGNERPYPLPPDVATLPLPPVCVEAFGADTRERLIAALDQVRVCAGVIPPHPFYL